MVLRRLIQGWAALFAVVVIQPGVWARAGSAYSGDDFWTLSPAGQFGLAALSVSLISAWFALSAALASWIWRWTGARPVALVEAAGLAALFVLLYTASPQIYYAYYQQIIPGLPSQWVISAPPREVLIRGLSFTAEARLAEHLAAGVFWATILAALWRRLDSANRISGVACVLALPFALRAIL